MMYRPSKLSVNATSDFKQQQNFSCCFEIDAPQEADQNEKTIHEFLDSIDFLFVNSLE
jgi:hypothetical protein